MAMMVLYTPVSPAPKVLAMLRGRPNVPVANVSTSTLFKLSRTRISESASTSSSNASCGETSSKRFRGGKRAVFRTSVTK